MRPPSACGAASMTDSPPVRVPDWSARPEPSLDTSAGRFVELERFAPERHGKDLFAATGGPANDDLWEFIPVGPIDSAETLATVLTVTNTNG